MNSPKKSRSAIIDLENGIVKLPLTTHTGKIRVKRWDANLNYGEPVAAKQQKFTADHYLEWQISYATENPPEESKVDDIRIDNKIGFELTKILYKGLELRLFSTMDFCELNDFIVSVQPTETLEENQKIHRENTCQYIKGGFKKFVEKVPIFIKENKNLGYFVEIALKHKQRGVGLQTMVYLCIYIEKLKDSRGGSLLGRPAKAKEFGILEITEQNKVMFMDVVKAFAIASERHKNDILSILQQIMNKHNIKCS